MNNIKGQVKLLLVFFLVFNILGYAQDDKTTADAVSAEALSQKTNAEDMAEALKSVPGVYIREGQINIRDASANKVLILIDGQRMNSAQSGGFDANTIPIDAVEKVEVLRGGNSARYGADAVGGVINFITKKADETSKMDLGLRATYGSFNSQYYNIFTSNAINDFNYYVSYKRAQSDGDFDYIDIDGTEKTREHNASHSNDGFVKLGYNNILPLSTLSLSLQGTQSKNESPGSIPGVDNWASATPRAELKNDNYMSGLNYTQQQVWNNADISVNAYYHYFRTRYDDPDAYPPTHSDHKNRAYGVDVAQNNPVSDLISLTYGYSYRHDNAESTSINEKDRNTHSAHAAVTFAFKDIDFFFDKISVVPAARYDAPNDFDKVVSPKISLMLANSSAYALNLNFHVSKSYKAPTFNDLYWPFDGYTVGNENLDPEKGMNYEAGYGITIPFLNNTQVNMNYFYSEIDDQIIWAPAAKNIWTDDGRTVWTPTNVSKSKTSGLETFIGSKFFSDIVALEITHTYMDARDKSGDDNDSKLLIYRPFHKADINAGFSYVKFSANVNYQFLSKRYVNTSNTKTLGDVSIWNMNFGYSPELIGIKWSARFDMNNIFDKNYRMSDGYPTPGREFRFSIGMNLL
jgi:vitamin B12 transporter